MRKILSGILGIFAVFSFTVVAHAETVVSPSSMNTWEELNFDSTVGTTGTNTPNPTTSGTDSTFVTGPEGQPMGQGSLRQVVGEEGYDATRLVTSKYNGLSLSAIDAISYSTFVKDNNGAQSPALQLWIDRDGAGPGTEYDRLFFEPVYQSGSYGQLAYATTPVPDQCTDPNCVVLNTWQIWDADSGGWWSEMDNAGGPPLTTLADYIAEYENATLRSDVPSVRIISGGGEGSWDNFEGFVDAFTFNSDVYDFEVEVPDTDAPDVEITNPAEGAIVSGSIDVRGTVTDDNPSHYYTVVRNSANQVVAGPGTVNEDDSFDNESLFTWDTTDVDDGVYTIHLAARDASDNRDADSADVVTVTVNNTPDNKNQCKNGGWEDFNNPSFRNQGQCIKYVNGNNGNKSNTSSSTVRVNQRNTSTVSNNVTVTQNTGGNKANRNTGNTTVTTGNNSSFIEVITRAARNIFIFR